MKRIRHIRQCRAGTRASNRRVPRARLSYGAAGLQGTAAGCSECAEDREAAHIRRPDRAAARTAERTGRQEAAGRTLQVVEGTIPLTAQRSFRLAGGRCPAAAQERESRSLPFRDLRPEAEAAQTVREAAVELQRRLRL